MSSKPLRAAAYSPRPVGQEKSGLVYQYGFGNEFESEALPGALPIGQNSPQRCPYGLMSELVSGTTLTNNWTPHGPETQTVAFAREMELTPMKIDDMFLVLVESRFQIQVTPFAQSAKQLLHDYTKRWETFVPYFNEQTK